MFTQRRWTYREVDNIDPANEKPSASSNSENPAVLYRKSTVVAAATLVGIAFFAALSSYQAFASKGVAIPPSQKTPITGPCGNSSAEAHALGCTFDQLMWAWYPPHCPHYANDEYLHAEPEQPWRFYTDPYKKTLASGEDWVSALDNKVPVWGERREHLTHCVYMYLSLGQIIRDGTRYTPRQVDYEHLEHCASLLLESLRNDTDWNQIQTKAPHVFYDQDC